MSAARLRLHAWRPKDLVFLAVHGKERQAYPTGDTESNCGLLSVRQVQRQRISSGVHPSVGRWLYPLNYFAGARPMLTRLIALLVLTGALSVRGQDALTPST